MKTDPWSTSFWSRRGLLLGLLLGLLSGTGCEQWTRNAGGGLPPDSLLRDRPTQVTRDARFELNKAGRRRAIIRAEQMQQYQTEDSTYSVWRMLSDSARVHSYVFEDGDSSATITADSVVFFNEEGRYEAYGNVVVVTQEGRRLESEHLTWLQGDRTIRTRRFVHITTPTEDVRGNGLVADEDLETYQIGAFTAEVEVEDEESP
jgi:LPS export ABC transporter protein LptC